MKTALLLLGFNRVDYFSKTLASLEENEAAFDCDLHVYLDGGPKAKQDELEKVVRESKFSDAVIVKRDSNWGVGRHLIDARRVIFDELNYDRLILFEDDMYLSPSYVKCVLRMSDWAHSYDDVGTVMAYNLNESDEDVQRADLGKVIATNRHFWGYCLTKKVWDDIKDILYDYERKYLQGVAYPDRAHRRIRWVFMRKWMKAKRKARKGKTLVDAKNLSPPFSKWPIKAPTSQDAVTALALWHNGYARLTTVVPRAEYIGVHGLSFTPEVWEAHGFNKQQFFDFSSEDDVEFELVDFKPEEYR